MRFFRSRRRVLLLVLAVAVGAGVWWWRTRPENPTLAGVPLAERAKGLKDPDAAVRNRTLRTLAAFGPKSRGAMPEVIEALDTAATADDAVLALGRMREDALPTLTEWLTAEKPRRETPWRDETRWIQRRRHATRALGFAGPCAVPLLLRYRDDPDQWVRTAVRKSIAQIALEHPHTLPELAHTLPELAPLDESRDWRAAIELDPKTLDIWKGMLDHPKPEVRLSATGVLVSLSVSDPRLIPGLCRNNAFSEQTTKLLLSDLHRAGHPVIPQLVAEMRAILAGERDLPEAASVQEVLRRCVDQLSALGRATDALVPELRALAAQYPTTFERPYAQFLSDYERRRAPLEPLLAVGGGAFAAAIPPTVLPELVAAARAIGAQHSSWLNGAGEGLRTHFRRAAPLVARELATASTERRHELLRVLTSREWTYRGESEVVPPELARAVAECLTDPKTRADALHCLRLFGPFAVSALPDLLDQLDETNFDTIRGILGAINRCHSSVGEPDGGLLDLLNAVDHLPAPGRYAAVRARFAKNPKREEVWKQLVEIREREPREVSDWGGSAIDLVLFTLDPAAERLARVKAAEAKRDRDWNWVRLAEFVAAADPVYFIALIDADVRRGFTRRDMAPALRLFAHSPEAAACISAVTRRVRRNNGDVADLLPPLCRNGTPKETAEALFELLGSDAPNVDKARLLHVLLELPPTPGKWTVPESARGIGGQGRLAEAVALRWNPDDPRALADLVRGYPGILFVPEAWYDPVAVRALAPLAATNPRARFAVIDLFSKAPRELLGEDFEVLYRAVRSAGKDGTAALVAKYLRTDHPGLLAAIRRLVTEGAIALPAFGQELREAKKLEGLLLELAYSDVGFAARLLSAVPDYERELRLRLQNKEPNDKSRWARQSAFYILSQTHPTDADVWTVAEVYVAERSPSEARGESVHDLLMSDPERAHPFVLRVLGKLPAQQRNQNRALVLVLKALPKRVALDGLADPDPFVRLCATRSLRERARESNAPQDWLTVRELAALGPLLGDPDPDVRTAILEAMRVMCDVEPHWRGQMVFWHPLAVLEPQHRALWIQQVAAELRLTSKDESSRRSELLAHYIQTLAGSDEPEFREYRREMERLLPEPEGENTASRISTGELLSLAHDRSRYGVTCRLELQRRAATDAAARTEVISAYLDGKIGAARQGEATAFVREIVPLAVSELIAYLNRPHIELGRGDCVIALLGELGPSAKDAVPMLLTFAADARLARRHAARAAIRQIAPEVFAELD